MDREQVKVEMMNPSENLQRFLASSASSVAPMSLPPSQGTTQAELLRLAEQQQARVRVTQFSQLLLLNQ